MANIKILVGTVYGNAQDVAELCAEQLQAAGHQVTLMLQATADQLCVEDTEVVLVCTSTTGQGEIPNNLLGLYCQLQDRLPLMPQVRYGVIALGDSSYPNFAEAGCLMDALFQELKLQRLGDVLFIDACETMAPREEAESWLQQWQSLL